METELLPTFGWFLHKSFAPAELQGSSGKPGHDSCTIATSTAGSGNKLPVLLLASMLLTRCACLVDEAVILIAALAARSVISRVRLPINMAFLFVAVNAVIQTARVLGVRMLSPYYLATDRVWIFFFCWVATDTATRQRPLLVANSL